MNRTPYAAQSALQLQCLLLLSFYTGLRPSSLVQYERGSSFAKLEDVKIIKSSRFSFTIELDIKTLKGWNRISKGAHTQKWVIHSASKVQPLGAISRRFETTTTFIANQFSRQRSLGLTTKAVLIGSAPIFGFA
ncbi:hypothetical protein CF319_g7343 [Tilletia indica]|nr:hypothetical protein CF319_g7343 [Tilletia indica]KAE8228275.1 hypothetical protein CF326_g6798 [Tilletia indica]